MSTKLYNRITVAKRLESSMAIYRCFQSLDDGLFYVQSADYFYGHSTLADLHNLNLQEIELFIEQDVSQRRTGFPSLKEAIADFDVEFGNE